MPREAIATAEIVFAACDAHVAEHGREPTVAEIIKAVGGGSATTVSKLRQDWLKKHRDEKAAQEPPKAEQAKKAEEDFVPARIEDMAEEAAELERIHAAIDNLLLRSVATRVQGTRDKAQAVQASLIEGYERKLRDKDAAYRETDERKDARIAALEADKEALDQQWSEQYDALAESKDAEIDGLTATIAKRDVTIATHEATIRHHQSLDAARAAGRQVAAEQRPETENPHTQDEALRAAWAEGWSLVALRARVVALENDLSRIAEEMATIEDERDQAIAAKGEALDAAGKAKGRQEAVEIEAQRLRDELAEVRPRAEAATRIPDLEVSLARADALAAERSAEIKRLDDALHRTTADLDRVRAERDAERRTAQTAAQDAAPTDGQAPTQAKPARKGKRGAAAADPETPVPEATP